MGHSNKKNGFTILELLIAMSVIAILSVSAILYFRGSIVEVSAESTIKTFVADISSAKGRAMAGDRGMSWGVKVIPGINDGPGSWEFFATSTNGISSEPFVPEVHFLSPGLSWSSPSSGPREVLFEPLTGKTNHTFFDISYGQTTFKIVVSQNGEIVVTRIM